MLDSSMRFERKEIKEKKQEEGQVSLFLVENEKLKKESSKDYVFSKKKSDFREISKTLFLPSLQLVSESHTPKLSFCNGEFMGFG